MQEPVPALFRGRHPCKTVSAQKCLTNAFATKCGERDRGLHQWLNSASFSIARVRKGVAEETMGIRSYGEDGMDCEVSPLFPNLGKQTDSSCYVQEVVRLVAVLPVHSP